MALNGFYTKVLLSNGMLLRFHLLYENFPKVSTTRGCTCRVESVSHK